MEEAELGLRPGQLVTALMKLQSAIYLCIAEPRQTGCRPRCETPLDEGVSEFLEVVCYLGSDLGQHTT